MCVCVCVFTEQSCSGELLSMCEVNLYSGSRVYRSAYGRMHNSDLDQGAQPHINRLLAEPWRNGHLCPVLIHTAFGHM